ncbi:MAG: phospholipase [Calditrichaeota bacterium]|nr:MAG: phospholipase [Calditrichota bacterium]
MVQERKLRVSRTARYYTLGPAPGKAKRVWFVCHGYGQLASHFIKHFDCLADDQTLIVAPEGLSRFYLDGFSGRIGSSWMTSEARETEIQDYLAYLDALSDAVLPGEAKSGTEVFMLGFSQGAATVSRWLAHGNVQASRLILWAGLLPPELPTADTVARFRRAGVVLVYGTEDELARPELLEKQVQSLRHHAIPHTRIEFSGGHHLDPEVLARLPSISFDK